MLFQRHWFLNDFIKTASCSRSNGSRTSIDAFKLPLLTPTTLN